MEPRVARLDLEDRSEGLPGWTSKKILFDVVDDGQSKRFYCVEHLILTGDRSEWHPTGPSLPTPRLGSRSLRSRVPSESSDTDFVSFAEEVLPKLWRLLLRSGVARPDAEDIAAEALARAFASWRRIGALPYRDAWALRVATNLLIDRSRRERRAGSVGVVRAAVMPGFENSSVDHATVFSALSQLPRRQREAIVLRYWSDLPVVEVAAALGVSTATTQTHLARAMTRLRAILAPHEGDARDV